MNDSYSPKIIITDILQYKLGPHMIKKGTDNPRAIIALKKEAPNFSNGPVVFSSYFTPSNAGSYSMWRILFFNIGILYQINTLEKSLKCAIF